MSKSTTMPKRGLAALTKERRREIARMGGKTVQKLGVGFSWTKEQASEAGKKGGVASGKVRAKKKCEKR